jgi:hypothetical protein
LHIPLAPVVTGHRYPAISSDACESPWLSSGHAAIGVLLGGLSAKKQREVTENEHIAADNIKGRRSLASGGR